MRIHCKTYRHLGFLLAMKDRGYNIELSGPNPGSVLRSLKEQVLAIATGYKRGGIWVLRALFGRSGSSSIALEVMIALLKSAALVSALLAVVANADRGLRCPGIQCEDATISTIYFSVICGAAISLCLAIKFFEKK